MLSDTQLSMPPSNQQAALPHPDSPSNLHIHSLNPFQPHFNIQSHQGSCPTSQTTPEHRPFPSPSPHVPLNRGANAEATSPSGPPVPACKKSKRLRNAFSGPELLQLAIASADTNPWGAPHGEKGKRWETVASLVRGHTPEFKKLNRSTNTYKSKCEALISWHTEEEDHSASTAIIDQEIIKGRDVRISIGAVLDKAATARVLAAAQSEEAKENSRILQQENNEGGASIRTNAMKTLARRHSSLDHDGSDKENDSPATSHRSKCRKRFHSQSFGRIEELLVKQEERRMQYDNAVLEEYRSANKTAQEFQASLLDVLKKLS